MSSGIKCPCGSGRQQKNCCGKNKKKDRTFSLHVDPQNFGKIDGLAISDQGFISGLNKGEIVPLVGQNRIEYSYKRSSGKHKVLTTGPISGANCYINPNLPIVEFDHLFAVDTNTRIIGKDNVSVGCIIHCKVGSLEGDSLALEVSTLFGWYEYRNIVGDPEKLFWKEMLEVICNSDIGIEGKVGFIVDSDLGNHEKFNNRELPIYENYYLPKRFTMIYGSTDVGKECLANKLISFCDQRSNYLLRYLDGTSPVDDNAKVEGRPYSHFRQWQAKEDHVDNHFKL